MRRLILAALLCLGCMPGAATPTPPPSATSGVAVTTAPPAEPVVAETPGTTPDAANAGTPLEAALARGAGYLASRADTTGVWRSNVYPPFKDGASLTPLCLRALAAAPAGSPLEAQGRKFLATFVVDSRINAGGISYPVYTGAGALFVASTSQEHDAAVVEAWKTYLLSHQLTEELGWQPDDPRYGGWSYAHEPPRKPAAGKPVPTLSEPNLSATVFALEALRAAGVPANAAPCKRARVFVERLQNYNYDPHNPASQDQESADDGGFRFVLDDVVRNKAGAVAAPSLVSSPGAVRFASYGSATADGLRALILCGRKSCPTTQAAQRWLELNFRANSHPGRYEEDREFARESLYFYYAASAALALEASGQRELSTIDGKRVVWAEAFAQALIARQAADGSWRNKAVDVREDDPLVATPLAMLALATCQRSMAQSEVKPTGR